MNLDDIDDVRPLIGDGVPSKSSLPAAWWLTTDPDLLAAYDRWSIDYDAHIEKVREFARGLGLEGEGSAYMRSHGTASVITGFEPTPQMRLWAGHPDHQPVPAGWRIDRKSEEKLVPSRKTKADREGSVVKAFAELKQVPNLGSYMSGLSTELHLEDRSFGGTIYYVRFRRGDACVWAYCGGDPERQLDADRRSFQVDAQRWHRMPLSTLAKLIEEKADRLRAAEATQ